MNVITPVGARDVRGVRVGMNDENPIGLPGKVVDAPELGVSEDGQPTARFRIAVSANFLDRGEWHEGEIIFTSCLCREQLAEKVMETVKAGMRVTATGRMRSRPPRAGGDSPRFAIEMEADAVTIHL